METEKQITEMELPQLRQMVLENTQRIEKNELMINEMSMKTREEEQKQRERETYWDVARDEHDRAHREHERDMRELRKILHEHSVSFDAAMKRSEEQREKSRQEFEERLKESDEKREKWHREFDESLRKSREEREEWHRKFEEDLKKSSERFEEDLKKSSERFEEDLKKSREDFDRRMKESDENLKKQREEDRVRRKESDENLKKQREEDRVRRKESDENLKKQREEDRVKMEELDKSVKRATEAVSNLARQVSSVTGNIVEGLLGPASRKMFIDAGYPISRCCKRVQIGDKDTRQTAMEIDVMEYGETMVVAVEVKADCEKKDILKILKKMVRFKELCPEHADKEVLAGVAAVNFEEGAYELAKESGLVIIHVREESVFELEPEFTLEPVPDKSVLRRF